MLPRLFIALTALVLTCLPTAASAAGQTLVSVAIVDYPRPVEKWGYAPGNRKVPVGSWVTWSNDGTDAHTVTATDGTFDSALLNPSEGFSWYFDQNGTYQYVCTLHDWMKGTIVVGNGVAVQAPAEPAPPPDEAPIEEPAPDPDQQ